MPDVDKNKLKTVFLRKRKTLSEEEYDKRNAKLFYSFSQLLDELEPTTIHTFIPLEKNMEVDTWIMIKYMKALGLRIAVSKMLPGSNDLEHFEFINRRQLVENKLGILEPENGENVPVNQMDVVLVPLIVFDRKGHRIGYGKGYYDKFMSQCKPTCIKIGLSLLTPLDKIPYMESHDIPLDYCISPIGIHQFNN
ncbi:MAG: 5-formyltetrahydrofolate cyclo-ligase [Reichenbachiella sp.]